MPSQPQRCTWRSRPPSLSRYSDIGSAASGGIAMSSIAPKLGTPTSAISRARSSARLTIGLVFGPSDSMLTETPSASASRQTSRRPETRSPHASEAFRP